MPHGVAKIVKQSTSNQWQLTAKSNSNRYQNNGSSLLKSVIPGGPGRFVNA